MDETINIYKPRIRFMGPFPIEIGIASESSDRMGVKSAQPGGRRVLPGEARE